ncbi:Riboflavin transporter MCH5 [Leucoagaricus sp. SymC.cos]|nr:Riboflavin transporter MCH5 [Leucoagaricus sp. SymC.cos]
MSLEGRKLSDEKTSHEAQRVAHTGYHDPDAKLSENAQQAASTQDDFPDGGLRAWIVVAGAMWSSFATFGFVNSWGPLTVTFIHQVFQAYYQEVLLRTQSPSTISWIGSIQYALVFFPGLVVGRLFDIGYFRALFLTSSALLVVATFLTAQCTQYWHFVLSQGIMAGLGCGGLFTCSNAVIAHWFKKKRGAALGFMAVGSAVSGTTIPIIVKNLLPLVGYRWTMRTLAFIFLFATTVSNLTMKARLPAVKAKGGLFNLAVFKDPPYTVYCLSSLIAFLGMYTFMTYVSVSAAQLNINPNLAFYFVAILNASSLVGRLSAGIMADLIGSLNVMAPCTAVVGAVTYAWPFARSTASLVVITVIYGVCCGAFVSLLPAPIMTFGGSGDVGRRVGMYLTIMAFGTLTGPPISGAINARTGGFEAVGWYAGSTVMCGALLMLVVRYLVLGRLAGKV